MRYCQNIVIHACKNITEKNEFIENVWPANTALFIYVSTHCAKQFNSLTTFNTLS